MSFKEISSLTATVNQATNNVSTLVSNPQMERTAAVSRPILENQAVREVTPRSMLLNIFLPKAWEFLPQVQFYYASEVKPCSPKEDPYKTYIDHYQFLTKRGREDVTVKSVFRGIFHACTTELMTQDCLRNMKSTDRILEVGAGQIDPKTGTSHLTSHFPKKFEENVTYSDGNPFYRRVQNGVRYEFAELTKLTEVFKKESFEHIVSCSSFDVVKWNDLENSFKQAYQVLKPNGKLFIYSNIQPLLNMLISFYSEEQSNIVFPLAGQDCFIEGIQILKREYLQRWLTEEKNKIAYPEEVKFMTAYLNLNSIERELFIINVGTSRVKYAFSEIVKQLFGDELKNVFNQEFYEENMRQNLLKAGFVINSFGLKSTTGMEIAENIPEICGKDNYFEECHGRVASKKIFVLAPGNVKLNFSMHAIIAEKKKVDSTVGLEVTSV